jgi:hypothetical protein
MLFLLCCTVPMLRAAFGFISPYSAYDATILFMLALMPFGVLQVFSCLYKIGETRNYWRVLHLGLTALFFVAWVLFAYFDLQETPLVVAGIYALYIMPIVLGIGYYLLVFSEYRAAKSAEML